MRRPGILVLSCAAFSGCGGGGPAAPAPTPPPATLADLSATVTSPAAGRTLNCREDVPVQITLTNRSASTVLVFGIAHSSRGVSGGCGALPDFTFQASIAVLDAGQTATVLNRTLYGSGSGCCAAGSACDGRAACTIEEGFTIQTTPGVVSAGSFSYQVNFNGCDTCRGAVAARGRACPARLD